MNNILRSISGMLLDIAGDAGHTVRHMLVVAMVLVAAGTAASPSLAQDATQTSVSLTPSPSLNGESVDITASVEFDGRNEFVQSVVPDQDALASLSSTVLTMGTYTATYLGPLDFNTSNDSAVLTVTPPIVTSVSPSSGPATGGTSVTATGTNFSGATAVAFGSTAATGFGVTAQPSRGVSS
jgi:hypothetical protein